MLYIKDGVLLDKLPVFDSYFNVIPQRPLRGRFLLENVDGVISAKARKGQAVAPHKGRCTRKCSGPYGENIRIHDIAKQRDDLELIYSRIFRVSSHEKAHTFELKSSSPPQNLVVWLLLLVTLLAYGAVNMARDSQYKNQPLTYDSNAWDAAIQLNLLLAEYPKDPPENIQKAMDLWRRDAVYSAQQRVFTSWVGEDRWRDVVIANINRNENLLQGLREGIISGKSKAEGGQRRRPDNNINYNRYFYDNDIKPPQCLPDDHPLIPRAVQLMPYLAADRTAFVQRLLVSADLGSYKFLAAALSPQEFFTAKALSSLVLAFIVMGSLFCRFDLSALNGTGSIRKPIAFDPNAFFLVCGDSKSEILVYLERLLILYASMLFSLYA